MVKRMQSDAVPLSSEDYKFIIIWRRQEVASVAENSNASAKAHVINGVDTVNKLTKKVRGEDGMYAIIECECREAEEAKR
ncbi:8304_t:CDS:2, partial [Diversispora eburnea]